MMAVTTGVITVAPDQTYASATGVPPAATAPRVVVPASGAAVSGTTALDAYAPNAKGVEFVLFGGSYRYAGKELCAATRTEVGWVCAWNATTVPNGSYYVVSFASTAGGTTISPGVGLTVSNSKSSTTTAPRSKTTAAAPTTAVPTTALPTTALPTTALPGAGSVAGIPNAPASLGVPTKMVLDDEFNSGSLNTSLWSPDWFGSGQESNETVMNSSNVSVDANGLELKLTPDKTGGLVSTDPDDAQPGHTGFQIAPTPGHPVYVEYKATLPTVGGQIANWPALWLTGQNWPVTGEIDVMEGFGDANWHGIAGPSPYDFVNPGGAGALAAPLTGSHTFGVLWSTTGVTFVYDGAIVGSAAISLTGPMYLVMENSLGDPASIPATLNVRYVRVWN